MNEQRPTLFLDFDDVFCLNRPYGGYDVAAPDKPADLWERLFHAPALEVLKEIVDQAQPRIVITTSWLRFLDREGFDQLFRLTRLDWIASALHEQWEAVPAYGDNRLRAIERWLARHHGGEPYVVLDDLRSGPELKGSHLDKQGRLVHCTVEVGLLPEHVPVALSALRTKPKASMRRGI